MQSNRQRCPVTHKNYNVLVFFFSSIASLGQARILGFSGPIMFDVVLTGRGRQQVIFAFVSSIKLKVSMLGAVLLQILACPHSSFLISVKQEQEAQLAEKGALRNTRLTICKLYVYIVLESLL